MGMQALQFCSLYPDKTFTAVPIACAASHSAQNIAFNELARQAIMADPEWDSGNYISAGKAFQEKVLQLLEWQDT